jgi:hypothetical protein
LAIDLETYRKLSTEERRKLPWKETWEIDRMASRYREAGHAVIAYREHWYTIKSVTATDEVQLALYGSPFPSTFADFWREASIILSGKFAEHIAVWGEVLPQPWEEFLSDVEPIREDEGLYDDMANIDDMQLLEAVEGMYATQLGKDDLEDLYDNLVEETRVMVSEDWSEIEAVACALESTGYLDGPEVVKIIKGTG